MKNSCWFEPGPPTGGYEWVWSKTGKFDVQ